MKRVIIPLDPGYLEDVTKYLRMIRQIGEDECVIGVEPLNIELGETATYRFTTKKLNGGHNHG